MGVLAVPKRMNKRCTNKNVVVNDVVGVKGICGQPILAFLEIQAIKCRL